MPDQYEGFEPDPEPSGFTPDPPKSMFDEIFTIPNALRFGGSALGTVAGGLATGGIGAGAGMFAGGAAGEAAARWWEGKDFDPTITAVEGALNLLPGGGAIPGKGAALKTIGKYALRQAGHGAWQGAAGAFPRHLAEAGTLWEPEKWEAPSLRDIGTQTVAGGVIGGATGGTLGAASSRFGKAKVAPLDIPSTSEYTPPDIRETHIRPAADTSRPIGEGESILDYITGKDDPDVFTSSVLNEPVQAAAPIAPQPAKFVAPEILEGESIIDYLRRSGVDNIHTTPEEAMANQAAQAARTQPQAAFDPNTLTGLQRAEVEFVDPTTGEVRSSADARPGDVPVTNEPKAAAPAAPNTVDSWIEELIKGESGEFDPVELGRNVRRMFGGGEEPAADVPATAARAARRVDPELVMPDVRNMMDGMNDTNVQNLINTFEGNPTAYGQSGANAALYGRDILDERQHRRSTLMDQFAPEPTRHGDISEQLTQALPPATPARPPRPGSYAQTVEQLSGMTPDEVRAYAGTMADHMYPHDIDPLIAELRKNPTEGTRAAIEFLEARRTELRSQGVDTGSGPEAGAREPLREPVSEGVLPVKPPVEVTPEMRERSRKRLAAIGGAERAEKLISGESVLGNLSEPTIPRSIRGRPNRGEKLRPEEAEFWNKWADEQINNSVTPDPNKPGMTIEPGGSHFPKYLRIQYRDAQGNPIGYLSTDLAGSGVQILAASPKLGLGRGRVAFAMLKEAFDRGITKAHGSTSDHTKNLVNRVGKLIRGEEGELDVDALIKGINEFMGWAKESKFGQSVGKLASRFLKEDTGEVDLGRLQELFQKKQDGTITPEELAEAKALAQEAKAAPAEQSEAPAPPKPTGQVTWSDTRKKKPAAVTTQPAATVPRAASLPAELAGAKPRFNIGADSFSPSFADDLDKALFIIAQKTRSKSDHKYLQFVMEQTGMDEASARLAGQGVRTTIKNQLSGAEPGVVRIESIWRKNQQPAATAAPKATPKVTTQEAGNGTIAKAANESPAAKQQTPEQAVAASMEAEQAAASLNQRLQRATENPNPANSQYEIDELLDEAAAAMNKLPEGQRAGYIRKVLGANKALLTAWDLSAPGRQGKAFIFNKSWWTSLDDMVKAWGSQKAADAVARSIIDHPSGYFKRGVDKFGKEVPSFAERMGLDLAGVEELFTINKGSAFEKYSGVGKSSRAHTAFLNKLRSDQFVAMMESAMKLGLDPQANLHQAKTYAKFINDATGRGSLNVGKWKLERNLGAINDVMFAPKNLSGQIRTWNAVLNPMKYASYDPVMRNQALRSLLAIAGSGLAVGELAKLMGGKVVDDPSSSDFRKIRVGDTRIDLFGGYQQFPVAAMKFLMNRETPTSGRDAGRTINFDKGGAFRNRATVAERFFTNRLSPAGSFVWAWMNNREFDGKPFEVKRALYERTAPIVLKDLYELAKNDPALAAIMTPTNTLGLTGTQTYGRN